MHVSVDAMSGGDAGSESGVVVCGGGVGENSARRRATGVGDAPWWWPAELRHYCR
jgi:hypothetical protein